MISDCLNLLGTAVDFEKASTPHIYYESREYHAFYGQDSRIRGYVVVDNQAQCLYGVFLGTKNWKDLVCDLKFGHVYTRNTYISGNIHRGFYQLYLDSCLGFCIVLRQLLARYPNYQLVVTGHSMGGVLAIFHSINLVIGGSKPIVIVFCLPKFADSSFNQSLLHFYQIYQTPFYQAKNQWDLVTRLPPSIFGYQKFESNCIEHRGSLRHPHGIKNAFRIKT